VKRGSASQPQALQVERRGPAKLSKSGGAI